MADYEYLELFVWDANKNRENIQKHNIKFEDCVGVFADPQGFSLKDVGHSQKEDRFFRVGKVNDVILVVRYTVRNEKIRIYGARSWRKYRKMYEVKNGKK